MPGLMPAVSVIIPNHNSGSALRRCLESLSRSSLKASECIVVDDGSTDDSAAIAKGRRVRVVSTGVRRGPAFARNLGARLARGNLLLFVDADVCVHRGTVERIVRRFAQDPGLDALMGSYDDEPAAPGFLSQYRNLLHCFVHQSGKPEASTFWSGCGAIRRTVFLAHGGFDTSYQRPGIEDIELGYRLRAKGKRIALDREAKVRHLKRRTLRDMVRTDVFCRAIPWTRLILKSRFMPNDLNVSWTQRISVAACSVAVAIVVLAAIFSSRAPAALAAAALFALLGVVLNSGFLIFLAARKSFWFMLGAIPVHVMFLTYSGIAFAVGIALHAWCLLRIEPGGEPQTAGCTNTLMAECQAVPPAARTNRQRHGVSA